GDDKVWVDGLDLAVAQQVAAAEYAPTRPLALRKPVAAETRHGGRQHHVLTRLVLRQLHVTAVVDDVGRLLVRVERRPPRIDQQPPHGLNLPLALTHRSSPRDRKSVV